LIAHAELLPVAAVCYESCNEETGCEEGAFSKAIHASGVCDNTTLPAAFTHGLIQLPYGPPLQLLYGMASAFISPPFSFVKDSAFVERFPVIEYAGGFMQAMLLLHGLWFGLESLEAAPNKPCGFLVFNLAPVFSSCIVSYTNIIGMLLSASLARTDDGLPCYHFRASVSSPKGVALVCSIIPLGAAAIYIVVLGVGAISIFVTSIPALFAFVHLVLVLGLAMISAIFISFIAASIMGINSSAFIIGQALGFDDADDDADDTGFAAFIRLASVLYVGACQCMQGLGVLCWTLYASGSGWTSQYKVVHSLFFEGFAVPPFHLDFNFALNFHLPRLFLKIVTFRLEAIELLGAALTVQLLTIVGGALPRFCYRHRESRDKTPTPARKVEAALRRC
jgi:hypothetical protein